MSFQTNNLVVPLLAVQNSEPRLLVFLGELVAEDDRFHEQIVVR